jgi:hypothetical protein
MKTRGFSTILYMLSMILLSQTIASAQFDDLYYKPGATKTANAIDYGDQTYPENNYSHGDYDGDEYDYYDDYDYEYSRRIRRFHRPNPGFGFYDPFFYDPFMNPWYNPFAFGGAWIGRPMNPWFRPGLSICYNRWNRWGSWGMGWGYSPWGFSPWNDPFMGWGANPWMMDPFMMGYTSGFNNGFMWGMNGGWGYPGMGWNNGGWNGNGWGGNNSDPNARPTVYTARRGGSVTSTPRAQVRTPIRDTNINIEKEADQGISNGVVRQTTDERRSTRESIADSRAEATETRNSRSNELSSGHQNSISTERPSPRFFQLDSRSSERETTSSNGQRNSEERSSATPERRVSRQESSTAPVRSERRSSSETSPRQESNSPRNFERSTSPAQRDSWQSSPRSSGSSGGGFNSGGSSRSTTPASSGGRTSPRG